MPVVARGTLGPSADVTESLVPSAGHGQGEAAWGFQAGGEAETGIGHP